MNKQQEVKLSDLNLSDEVRNALTESCEGCMVRIATGVFLYDREELIKAMEQYNADYLNDCALKEPTYGKIVRGIECATLQVDKLLSFIPNESEPTGNAGS